MRNWICRLDVRATDVLLLVLALSIPSFVQAQDNEQNGLVLTLQIDSKKNQGYVKADDQFSSFVYEMVPDGANKKVQLASKDFMGIWKGNKTLEEVPFASKLYFETDDQFAPVFLVGDLRNDSNHAFQVTSAYLDVSKSETDLQPFLDIGDWGRLGCSDGSYNPKFSVKNYGWGGVRDPQLVHTFGTGAARSKEYVAPQKAFDQATEFSIESSLLKAGVDVARIKQGKFKCASKSQVPTCFEHLKNTGVLGDIADFSYVKEDTAFTAVAGQLRYNWISSDGQNNRRVSPLRITISLFHFDVGGGPECGAPGPVDRNEKPITLGLDKRGYRIPLSWHGQISSRADLRFGFSLAAAKASHHLFRLVLQLADGNVLQSSRVDLSYFKPRLPKTE